MRPVLNIVVLGCGYIGAAFARIAKSQGHHVTGVVRSIESRDKLRADGILAEALDLYTGDLSVLPKSVDAVVYAASTGGGGPEAYDLAYNVGVKRAIAWAKQVGATHFIFTSSTGVYRQDDGGVVSEESEVGGAETADAILQGERAVMAAGFKSARVLRFGGLYGPGRHHLLDQIKRGECVIGGRVDHFINYLHRDDAAHSVLAAITSGPDGARVYNITDGKPVTKKDLALWIAKHVGGGDVSFDVNAPAGPRIRKGGRTQPNRIISNQRVLAELAWKPKYSSIYDGLSQLG